jgi:hypothetical protein
MCCVFKLHVDMANIVQKIVNKRANVNANCENGKKSFAFNSEKQLWSHFDIVHDIQSPLCFIFFKLL